MERIRPEYVYLGIFIHRDGFRSLRERMWRQRETIRVKWPKFSQQISLTKIQSRPVAIEGCIVEPWKMAVGNNRITFALVERGGRSRRDEEVGETGK